MQNGGWKLKTARIHGKIAIVNENNISSFSSHSSLKVGRGGGVGEGG